MQGRTAHAERLGRRAEGLRQGQHRLAGPGQRLGQRRIGRKARAPGQRHLEAREQRRGIHVVLQQRVGQHQIAHLHAVAQAAGHAGEDQRADAEALGQQRRGGRRRDLADAAQHQHHRHAVQLTDQEVAPGMALALEVGLVAARQQRGKLLMQCADDRQRPDRGRARHLGRGRAGRRAHDRREHTPAGARQSPRSSRPRARRTVRAVASPRRRSTSATKSVATCSRSSRSCAFSMRSV